MFRIFFVTFNHVEDAGQDLEDSVDIQICWLIFDDFEGFEHLEELRGDF